MSTTVMLSREQMDRVQELATAAVGDVSRALTEMFGAVVGITAPYVRVVALHAISGLVGCPDLEVVAVYLTVGGAIPAHLLLLLEFPTALELCDILLELEPGTTAEIGNMEASALGEVGNIVGSCFLNSLAEHIGLRLDISPPAIVCDMAGAAIGVALTEVAMSADQAVVINANFEHQSRRLPAWFMAFPDPDHLRSALDQSAA